MNSLIKRLSILLLTYVTLLSTPLPAEGQRAYSDYLTELEDLHHKKFKDILLQETENYLFNYPNAENADKIQLKRATIFSDDGKKIKSFFTHMEIIYLYPKSEVISISKDRIRSYLQREKKFSSLKDRTDKLLNVSLKEPSHETAYFNFIRDMHSYNFEPITRHLIKSCEMFLMKYPKSENGDDVQFWKAQLLAKDNKHRKALSEFIKLTYLYDKSLYVSASKLKMAELFTENLKMHEKATLTLEEFLLEYPNDPQAAQAQFQIARINEKKHKKYREAIEAYSTVSKKYPASVEAVPALFEAARIYEEKLKEYDMAIGIHTDIVRDYPKDIKAPYAMAESARIYERRLKDYLNAANVYFKVYGHYPASAIAAESLYAAAEISEKRLKDYERAIRYYRIVVDEYPRNKKASNASKRIDDLTKKINKSQ